MQKEFKSVAYRILCILLVITLVLGVFTMTACNSDDKADATEQVTEQATEPQEELAEVVVFKKDVVKGTRMSSKSLEVVEMPKENLPPNVVSSIGEVSDMYITRDFCKGDYLRTGYLVSSKDMIPHSHLVNKTIDTCTDDYLTVTDYVRADTGEDLYIVLQELIDKNPGRTLYFPDGEYVISEGLITSSEPSMSNSFYLSSGAVIKAADSWEKSNTRRALICLGAKANVNNIKTPGSNFFVMGGLLDGNGIADGVMIAAGRETLIKNVVMVNVVSGIYIGYGTNNGSADADIDDVTIVGNGKFNSTGVAMSGCDNTVTNLRISNVGMGIAVAGGTFVSNCTVENTAKIKNAVGFSFGGSAWVSDCVSVDFETAFSLSGSVGFFKQCNALWNTDIGDDEQIAFSTPESNLGSSLIGCKAYFNELKVQKYFLKSKVGGGGAVISPIFDSSLVCDDDLTKEYIALGSKMPT